MNNIFYLIFLLSSIIMLGFQPNDYLTALQSGGQEAFNLFCKLVVLYAVWLGFFAVVKNSGLSDKLARLLKPLNRFLFGNITTPAQQSISLNLSCALLGMGSASSTMGFKGMDELEKTGNHNAMCMLFILNVTAIQFLPTSVISLRAQCGSTTPTDIILPTLLTTVATCLFGVTLCKILNKPPKRNKLCTQ